MAYLILFLTILVSIAIFNIPLNYHKPWALAQSEPSSASSNNNIQSNAQLQTHKISSNIIVIRMGSV